MIYIYRKFFYSELQMPTLVNKQTYLESGQQFETKQFSGVSYIDALLNRGGEGLG